MSVRLHLGGTRHGQILVTPDDDGRDVVWTLPGDPASFWERDVRPLDRKVTTETYVPKKLGLFGRTLTVMVERSVLWNEGQIETWAMEFLVSTLARTLMNQDGGR